MEWTSRVAACAVILGGALAAATTVQLALVPTLHAWQGEVVAALLRGLPA